MNDQLLKWSLFLFLFSFDIENKNVISVKLLPTLYNLNI